jgi:hypothetical protein
MPDNEILSVSASQTESRAENPTVRRLDKLGLHLVDALVPADTPDNAVLEVVVTIEASDIPTREFASYLALIDRLYGRLCPGGLMSYAHKKRGRLRIAEVHRSDVEVIFRTLYGSGDIARLIVIVLFLRALPNMFKLGTEAVKNLADSYKSFEEGRLTSQERKLAKESRKRIKETVREEPAFVSLEEQEERRLIALLEDLIAAEYLHLPAPIEFAQQKVKGIVLRVREPSESELEENEPRKLRG